MDGLAAAAVPPSLLIPTPSADPQALAQHRDAADTAQAFESSFLSIMLQQMFAGVDAEAPFGGGPGESMFRSFMTDAFAKQMTKAGGVGIADAVTREMLKMQGLE